MSTKIHVMRLRMMGSPENCFVSCPESASEGWRQRWELGVQSGQVFLTCPHLDAAEAQRLRLGCSPIPAEDADPLVFPEPFLFP